MIDPASSSARMGATPFRRLIQLGFALGSILTGIQFCRFVAFLADEAPSTVALRPAAVDAWLGLNGVELPEGNIEACVHGPEGHGSCGSHAHDEEEAEHAGCGTH